MEKKMTSKKAHSKKHTIPQTSKILLKKYRYFTRRINHLWSKRQRIESVLYMGILIEYFVKESIFLFEKLIEGTSYGANIGFNPRNLYNKKEIESQPLGYLIHILNAYTKDQTLIRDLKLFSKKRNAIIHKLFHQDIRDVKKQLKGFDVYFYELMIQLLTLVYNLHIHANNEYIYMCDDCFKNISAKQVKF
jgi:hypothetical protein